MAPAISGVCAGQTARSSVTGVSNPDETAVADYLARVRIYLDVDRDGQRSEPDFVIGRVRPAGKTGTYAGAFVVSQRWRDLATNGRIRIFASGVDDNHYATINPPGIEVRIVS